MEVKEIQNKKAEVVVDVICDCCGNSCKKDEGVIDNKSSEDNGEKWYSFNYMTLQAYWGYGSNKDMEKWSAQICENCADTKFPFIKFKKEGYNPTHKK